MENYKAAFWQRSIDTEILYNSGRKIAAMHFGGITIECLLKSIIFDSLPPKAKREWKTDFNQPGHTITNPGHSFDDALKRHNILNYKIKKFPEVKKWLKIVENPKQNFIDIRYEANEPDEALYKQWYYAYKSLVSWLQEHNFK